jgi:hypothetical protein
MWKRPAPAACERPTAPGRAGARGRLALRPASAPAPRPSRRLRRQQRTAPRLAPFRTPSVAPLNRHGAGSPEYGDASARWDHRQRLRTAHGSETRHVGRADRRAPGCLHARAAKDSARPPPHLVSARRAGGVPAATGGVWRAVRRAALAPLGAGRRVGGVFGGELRLRCADRGPGRRDDAAGIPRGPGGGWCVRRPSAWVRRSLCAASGVGSAPFCPDRPASRSREGTRGSRLILTRPRRDIAAESLAWTTTRRPSNGRRCFDAPPRSV